MAVPQQRKQPSDSQQSVQPSSLLLGAETLRLAQPVAAKEGGDEKMSLFWRVFGGTLLSIAAMVTLTVYQQVNGTLNELRASLTHLNESQADLVKKEDLNNRTAALWATLNKANADVPALRARTAALEAQLKVSDGERKTLADKMEKLSERLAKLEGRAAVSSAPKARPSKKEGAHD